MNFPFQRNEETFSEENDQVFNSADSLGLHLLTLFFAACTFLSNLCQTRKHKFENGPRHSRCTTPQRQTRKAILHHHQCTLRTRLSSQRYCMYFSGKYCGVVFGVRQVGGNLCVQLEAIFNSSSLPAQS